MKPSNRAGPRAPGALAGALAVVLALVLLVPVPSALAGRGGRADPPGRGSAPATPDAGRRIGHPLPEPEVLAESIVGAEGAVTTAVPMPAPAGIDMRVLVIHTDHEQSYELEGITDALERMGMPYDTLFAVEEDLTLERLVDEGGHGAYYAVILTTGDLGYWQGGSYTYAFDADEWNLLWSYEAAFGVRQATSFTAPYGYPDDYGLVGDGEGGSPLDATLTDAGHAVFPELTGAPIPIRHAWTYFGSPGGVDATATPLLVDGDGHALASIATYPDGRENLTITVAKNDWALHSLLLWGGMIDWVTRGVHLGARHVSFSPQVDDLLIEDDIWVEDEGSSPPTGDPEGSWYRLTDDDFRSLVDWQEAFRSRFPLARDVRLEMAFNGEGATPGYVPEDAPAGWVDTLTPAVKQYGSAFTWVNHAFSHLNMDAPTTYAEAAAELKDNDLIVKRTLKLSKAYDPTSFVQPDISGLDNPAFLTAAADFGIRYLISDTSRPGWGNPTPNTGIVHPLEPRLLVIPRRPSNLFYNLSTPDEWVSEYNCYYGPDATCAGGAWSYWDHDLTYDEILDVESDYLLALLLKWDVDPLMFHQANLREYEEGHSLLGDLIEATFEKYTTYYDLPVQGLTQAEIGQEMLARMAADDVGLTAEIVPCDHLTLTADADVTIDVTGIWVNKRFTEEYGGDLISEVRLGAGVPETYSVSCGG